MLRNYFKIAVRNLLKRPGFSIITILGLASGLAVCLLILLFVQSELGYDQYHKKGEDIYRVVLERKYPGRSSSYSIIPQSIGPAIQKEFPEVKACTRLFNFTGNGQGNFFMRVGDKTFEEKKVLAVDSNFFSVFTGQFIAGDPQTALQKPNSVVLSEATAQKIYGSAQAAMGQQFQTDGDQNNNNTFMVTGICKDWPENNHFTFNVLLSDNSFPGIKEPNYTGFAAHTYLLLSPASDAKKLESRLPLIVDKYVSGEIERNFGQSFADFQKAGNGYHYYLQPLRKIHLISDLEAELSVNGSYSSVYIFSIIAIFILFLACINYVNLSTARSVERAREVGIRKTFGSEKKAIVLQFLIESVVISILSMVLALGLIILLLPLFNTLSGKDLSFFSILNPVILVMLLVLVVVIGIVAGIYPALVLSSFQPIVVLKGRFKSNKFGLLLRNGLVTFQFMISVVLIIASIVVNQQMRYMLGEKLGFKKDHIIAIERGDLLNGREEAFKTELLHVPGVEIVSGCSALPGTENFFGTTFNRYNSTESVTGRGIVVDQNFARTLGLELKEGRFFSKDFGTDTLSVVLNERAVQEFGLTDAIGARMTTPDANFNAPDGKSYVYTVIGVVKDFHFQSLHQKITPLIFINSAKVGNGANVFAVRIKTDHFAATLDGLEHGWKQFVKDRPFHFNFLDQTLAEQYKSEQTIQRLFNVFSMIAILIACIGLLGLVAYTTQQRMREISIRKVLGASPAVIAGLLSKDFLKPVLLATLIGFPIGWLGMHKWLQDFAYRVDLSWWVFIVAAVLTVSIAVVTVSFQALKAAWTRPVKNLRAE